MEYIQVRKQEDLRFLEEIRDAELKEIVLLSCSYAAEDLWMHEPGSGRYSLRLLIQTQLKEMPCVEIIARGLTYICALGKAVYNPYIEPEGEIEKNKIFVYFNGGRSNPDIVCEELFYRITNDKLGPGPFYSKPIEIPGKDEIKEYREFLDKGTITREDFSVLTHLSPD